MAGFNLGTLSGTPVAELNNLQSDDSSSEFAGTDFSFSLASTSNLNVGVDVDAPEPDIGGDIDVRVYRDTDNDGEINSSIDQLIGSSTLGGDSDESINLESVAAGNYIVQLNLYGSSGNANYNLSLSTADPSNLLPTEVEVGTLNATQTFTDFVGSTDTADVYHFSVDTARDFSLSLTDLSGDADVRLIQDTNSNGIVDVDLGEVIGSSTFSSTTSDEINAFLNPGDNYFVQVYQHSGDTDYTLGLTA